MNETREARRLRAAHHEGAPWLRWGPYLAERQWGTVREDPGDSGDPWRAFTHDMARSRAYRWGEDGIAGLSDDGGRLCLALALWNGADPILKERLFGLSNEEGNHGEDAKEYWFHLDSAPTHSWMRYLYKYPQRAFPYDDLVATNAARTRADFEYELLDSGAFAGGRYFDVYVEVAKAAPEELLVRVTAWNRGPVPARLHLLPTLWFRNTWAWARPQQGAAGAGAAFGTPAPRPSLATTAGPSGTVAVRADHPDLGTRWLVVEGDAALLFTENETNHERLDGTPNASPWVKDAFNRFVVDGEAGAVNPAGRGTKATAHVRTTVAPGAAATLRYRLTALDPAGADARRAWPGGPFGASFERTLGARSREADAFYASITPPGLDPERARVMRRALAGMLWTKQHYAFDVEAWLDEHGAPPFGPPPARQVRNADWGHVLADDVISMPDAWEYPWFAAWDLALHTVALDLVDPDFARRQLALLLGERYQHPNGQIPAYEWDFGAVNPPVHAWAALFAFGAGRGAGDAADLGFLEVAFQKLLLTFTWWVNRKDPDGRNVFQGGFLGLDNIGVFDRGRPLPGGGTLAQADGTAWMALFCQSMFQIALELTAHDEPYAPMAVKFAEHFLWIAAAMDRPGDPAGSLWDEEDGFFYDLLRLPDGRSTPLRVRSLVGLLPLCATTVVPAEVAERFPGVMERLGRFAARHPELTATIADPDRPGVAGRRLLSVLDERKLRRILARMLDEDEFLSPHGIRSLSKHHEAHPFELDLGGEVHRVAYEPAESTTAMFGGNSNWRGPVWLPVNFLIVRALLQAYLYYGDTFRVECPTGSGVEMTLFEVAREVADRLVSIFLPDADGRRPVYGGTEAFRDDPAWRDHLLFFEYFNGDDGAGLGASHQTGWTGLVARLIQLFAHVDPGEVLRDGQRRITTAYRRDVDEGPADADDDLALG